MQKHLDAYHKYVMAYNSGKIGADALGTFAVKVIERIMRAGIHPDEAQKMVWDHTKKAHQREFSRGDQRLEARSFRYHESSF